MNKFARVIRNNKGRVVAAAAALAAVGSAHAAGSGIDTSAMTGAISDYSTAALAVLAALTTAVVAVWGVRKLVGFFGSK